MFGQSDYCFHIELPKYASLTVFSYPFHPINIGHSLVSLLDERTHCVISHTLMTNLCFMFLNLNLILKAVLSEIYMLIDSVEPCITVFVKTLVIEIISIGYRINSQ